MKIVSTSLEYLNLALSVNCYKNPLEVGVGRPLDIAPKTEWTVPSAAQPSSPFSASSFNLKNHKTSEC